MTSMLKPVLFIVFVVGQLGVLGWMIFERQQLAEHGTVIRLQCQPVDPRSLLSGDYVILNYKISRFDAATLNALVQGEQEFGRGKPVWVALRANEETGFYEASAIAADRQLLLDERIVLRGRARRARRGFLEVRYGLESYFVPQNEGQSIERQMRDTSVDVAVNEKGDSTLIRLFINDKEVKFH